MTQKAVVLSPKKGGNSCISSYTINIGNKEATSVGFVGDDVKPVKIIDEKNWQIIIQRADKPVE